MNSSLNHWIMCLSNVQILIHSKNSGSNKRGFAVLDDQPGQYWIYANTDNELATVHIKVDCE